MIDALPTALATSRREVGDPDLLGRDLGGHLDQPHRALREREHERRLRERHAAQQRLEVVAVGDLHERREPVGQPERPHAGGGREHRQADRLRRPELLVVVEVVEVLADLAAGSPAASTWATPGGEVLQLDPGDRLVLRQVTRRQVERHATASRGRRAAR